MPEPDLSFIINDGDGTRPPLVTAFVRGGVESRQRRARLFLIAYLVFVAVTLFSVEVVLGSLHAPWYTAVAVGLMIAGVAVAGVDVGTILGVTRTWTHLSHATIEVTAVKRKDLEE